MSFAWREYLDLAKWLNANPEKAGTQEASYRAAISRAYYAAFQCALEFATDEGYQPSKRSDDHGDVREHFRKTGKNSKDSGDSAARTNISSLLQRMCDNRRQADYRANIRNGSAYGLASTTIGMAEGVLRDLEKLEEIE